MTNLPVCFRIEHKLIVVVDWFCYLFANVYVFALNSTHETRRFYSIANFVFDTYPLCHLGN